MVRKFAQTAAIACLSVAGLLGLGTPSFALGMPDPLNYDMGPLGNWALSGGVSGFGAIWNNRNTLNGSPQSNGVTGDWSLENAMIILNKTDGELQFTVWVGIPPDTAVLGYTSPNVGPNLYGLGTKNNPLGPGGATGHTRDGASPLFKGFATYAPAAVSWFSVQGGRLPSPDGTEIGVDWFNPTPFVSDLNNMQTTTANGGQVNFIAGPDKAFYYGFVPGYGSTLTIRLADGYHTSYVNELGFTGLWNLNSAGTDYIVGFGHTRLSRAGSQNGGGLASAAAGFGTVNADLIGIGGQYVTGPWTFIPQAQYQWLPNNIVTGAQRPMNNYSEASAELTTQYQIDQHWSLSGIVQFVAQNAGQHNGSNDPNAEAYGDFLGLNGGPGGGTFGPGSDMFSVEAGPTWQFHNFFVRPAVTYTHLSSFFVGNGVGNGYGATGNQADQFVGFIEIGFMIGQNSD